MTYHGVLGSPTLPIRKQWPDVMPSQSGCPEQDALKNFASGLLDGPTAAGVWAHLQECDPCRAAFDGLRNVSDGSRRDSTAGNELTEGGPDADGEKDENVEMATLDIRFLTPANDPKVLGRLGTCNVLTALGRGGMGVVFKAFDTTLHRMVAIKVLSPQLASSPEANRRFLREARAAAGINHPNVVVIHAVGEQSGMPYLVMEFVAGRTLHARIRSGTPFDLPALLRIAAQTADGLAAAHRQGVVHRDIKPRNIMLENGIERVKITDFGLALAALDGSQITSVNRVVGTPAFMSPEQVHGVRVDRRSDLFSLGCVLHAMVMGKSPFQGSHALEIARKVVDCPVPPLHQLAPRVPLVVSKIVSKLLEKDPARRYQSADELHVELLHLQNQFGSGKSTISYPITPLKANHSQRRRLGMAGAATAVIVAAILVAWAGAHYWPAPTPHLQVSPTNRGPQSLLRVAQSGEADYRTIGEAVAKAEPGAVIRVLDGGTYRESLHIVGAAHRGLTLEAPEHATLEVPDGRPSAVRVENVLDVTLRGFQIKMAEGQHGVVVVGPVSGLVIEDVRFNQDPRDQNAGLYLLTTASGPIQVRNCTFRCGQLGLVLGSTPGALVTHVLVENNRFLAATTHLFFYHAVQDVTVRGNVFVTNIGVGVNLDAGSGSQKIRVSNNTFLNSSSWMTFEGADLPPESTVCNNLVLGAEGVNLVQHPVDEIANNWTFHNNWWEPALATELAVAERLAEVHPGVDVLSRQLDDPNFLRPAPNSPLGTAGAGGDEPAYVGAFPPGGAK
jgi:eukaryotic-like serine/threonine-protein kinase